MYIYIHIYTQIYIKPIKITIKLLSFIIGPQYYSSIMQKSQVEQANSAGLYHAGYWLVCTAHNRRQFMQSTNPQWKGNPKRLLWISGHGISSLQMSTVVRNKFCKVHFKCTSIL